MVQSLEQMAKVIEHKQGGMFDGVNAKDPGVEYRVMGWSPGPVNPISRELEEVAVFLEHHDQLATVSPEDRSQFRKKILLLEDRIKDMECSAISDLSDAEKSAMNGARVQLRRMTDYAPSWVILIVATAIGLGTMVGWKKSGGYCR